MSAKDLPASESSPLGLLSRGAPAEKKDVLLGVELLDHHGEGARGVLGLGFRLG